MGFFFYTRRDGICLLVRRLGSLCNTRLLESVWWFAGWGVSLTRPVQQSVSSLNRSGITLRRLALESVSSFFKWGISRARPAGGEFLLHAPCSNQSGRRSGGESILHASSWYLCRRLATGKPNTCPLLESFSSISDLGDFSKRPVL